MFPISLYLSFGLLLSSVHCQISSYYSNEDLQILQQKAFKTISSSRTLKHIYYSVSFLKQSGQDHVSCNCNAMQELISKATSAYDIFYGLSSEDVCQCGIRLDPDLANLARNSLHVTHYINSFFHSLISL